MNTDNLPVIAGVQINTDQNGRFNLNALHRASGGAPHRRPSEWLSLEGTKELIEVLSGNSRLGQELTSTMKGGANPGTYADRRLAVAYASWISQPFFATVIDVFLAYRDGELVQNSVPSALRQRFDSLVESKAKGLISGFRAEQLAIEAIRSNWATPAALLTEATEEDTLLKRLLSTRLNEQQTVYELVFGVAGHKSGYGEDEEDLLARHGIRALHGRMWIDPQNAALVAACREHTNTLINGFARDELDPEWQIMRVRGRSTRMVGIPLSLIR